MRPEDAPHRQLWIVGKRRSDPDHDSVDQGAQPVQVVEAVGAVDVVGVPGQRGGAPVKGLADLPDHGQIIERTRAQRPENRLPFCRGIVRGITIFIAIMTITTNGQKRRGPPTILLRS